MEHPRRRLSALVAATGAMLLIASSASAGGCGYSGGRVGSVYSGYGCESGYYQHAGGRFDRGVRGRGHWDGRSRRGAHDRWDRGCDRDGRRGRRHGDGVRIEVKVRGDDCDRGRGVKRPKDPSNHHAYRLTHFDKYPDKAKAWGLKRDKAQKKIHKIEKKQRTLERKKQKLEKKRKRRRHKK